MKNIISYLAATAAAIFFTGCADNTPKDTGNFSAQDAVIENIMTRASVREYLDTPVEQEKIDILMKAAMAAPSGMDRRPWEFVVVNDREILGQLAEGLQNAGMLSQAPMAVIVCGNTERSSYWYLDCSAATQNILLAAHSLGLGAVWTAAYPYNDRMAVIAPAIGLPENVMPLAVIPVGYPAGEVKVKDKFRESKVHYNKY